MLEGDGFSPVMSQPARRLDINNLDSNSSRGKELSRSKIKKEDEEEAAPMDEVPGATHKASKDIVDDLQPRGSGAFDITGDGQERRILHRKQRQS